LNLTSGQRLGPHEIVSSIGAGGMGEVYLARDTRLDRNVAIKVLPAEFSANASLKIRFEREAKAISALNHPNICTLHDIGYDGGIDYLVMEHIEGETLQERLRRGALPVEQVLRHGAQIAGALDAAHRHGIIHRDLKPANVMLTRSGTKLLDFGIAKESSFRAAMQSDPTSLPTEQKALTAEGAMIGTFQYMAPEQLEGAAVDARTDIFALGTLLYEMTTGVRAFDGKTKASVITAIASSQPPPISTIQPMTPPALEHVIRRCHAKDPEDRWQSAADIASQLQWISETGSQVAPVALRRRRAVSRYLWPAAALIAGLIAGAAVLSLRPSAEPSQISHFQIGAPGGRLLDLVHARSFAIAPDATTIVFTARTGEGRESALFLRKNSGFEVVQIAESADPSSVAFSPDSRWVLFVSGGKMKKVSVDGGKPVDLLEIPYAVGVHWYGSTIYFNQFFSVGMWSVPADGGEKTLLFHRDASKNEGAVLYPQLLPDGKHLLFTIWRGSSFDESDIAVRSLESGEQKILVRGGCDARYLPTGHLVYGRGGALLAVPFDADKREIRGAPVIVLEDVATGIMYGEVHFSVSERGTLVYAPGGVLKEERDLVWVDRKGEATAVVPTRRNYNNPKLAPDGATIALTIESSEYDIWLLDLDRDSVNRLSFGANDNFPVWSSDGSRVAWTSSRTGQNQIFTRPADASGPEAQLTKGKGHSNPLYWASDGTLALLGVDEKSPRADVWLLPDDGSSPGEPLIETPYNEDAAFSRDGRWIALASDESGRDEIYVMPFRRPGPKLKVSIDGGTNPVWSHDSREIFFRKGKEIYGAAFDPARMITVGRPALLFEGPYLPAFDVAPDGRFLMVRVDEKHRTMTNINVISGWFDELRRRVPAK
jgi:eukaryotic-like serine/threonine-protein kinase